MLVCMEQQLLYINPHLLLEPPPPPRTISGIKAFLCPKENMHFLIHAVPTQSLACRQRPFFKPLLRRNVYNVGSPSKIVKYFYLRLGG